MQVCYYADIVYLQDLKQMQPCRIASEITCSTLSLQDAKHYLLSYINIPYIPNQIPRWVQNDLPCFAYKFLCFIFSIKSPIWSIHTVLNNSKCLQQQQAQLQKCIKRRVFQRQIHCFLKMSDCWIKVLLNVSLLSIEYGDTITYENNDKI